MGSRFKVDGHDLRLLYEPEERLGAIIALIDAAERSVMLSIYMFHNDESGLKVRAALIMAAQRGVTVILLIDSFGSSLVADSFFKPIAEAGGQYHYFSSRWRISYFIRNHQKLLVIDDQHALVGGYNISDQYFGKSGANSWEDIGIVLSGPQVASMGEYLRKLVDLSDDGGVKLLALRKLIRSWQPGSGPIQWLVGGPTNRISPWALALKRDLQRANRADLVAAYFSPSQTILRRIAGVARRGGVVRMIMAGRSDNGATIAAARIVYGYLLKRQVNICEFQPLLLHTKLLVIDDAVYLGSANLDIRSLFINKEVMLRIEDKGLAEHLRRYVRELEAHSLPQDAEQHRKRMGLLARIRSTLAYLLVNSLDYNIGRRIRFGMRKLLPRNE
jgi:cardiolipin synthase A/B